MRCQEVAPTLILSRDANTQELPHGGLCSVEIRPEAVICSAASHFTFGLGQMGRKGCASGRVVDRDDYTLSALSNKRETVATNCEQSTCGNYHGMESREATRTSGGVRSRRHPSLQTSEACTDGMDARGNGRNRRESQAALADCSRSFSLRNGITILGCNAADVGELESATSVDAASRRNSENRSGAVRQGDAADRRCNRSSQGIVAENLSVSERPASDLGRTQGRMQICRSAAHEARPVPEDSQDDGHADSRCNVGRSGVPATRTHFDADDDGSLHRSEIPAECASVRRVAAALTFALRPDSILAAQVALALAAFLFAAWII